MKFQKNKMKQLMVFICLLLSGCAMVPESLKQPGLTEVKYQQAQQSPEQFKNALVRWGGVIVKIENKANVSIIEVLMKNLSSKARPRYEQKSPGRFLVEVAGFIDPEVFAKGSELTVVGELQGLVSAKVGEFDYSFPVLKSRAYYLWPDRVDVETIYSTPAYWYYPWNYMPYHHPVIIHKKKKQSTNSGNEKK